MDRALTRVFFGWHVPEFQNQQEKVSSIAYEHLIRIVRQKKRIPDPAPKQQQTSGWKVLLSLAIGLGFVLLAALAGLDVPPPGHPGSLPGSGNAVAGSALKAS